MCRQLPNKASVEIISFMIHLPSEVLHEVSSDAHLLVKIEIFARAYPHRTIAITVHRLSKQQPRCDHVAVLVLEVIGNDLVQITSYLVDVVFFTHAPNARRTQRIARATKESARIACKRFSVRRLGATSFAMHASPWDAIRRCTSATRM